MKKASVAVQHRRTQTNNLGIIVELLILSPISVVELNEKVNTTALLKWANCRRYTPRW